MTNIVQSIVNVNPGAMRPVGVVIHNDAGTLTGVGYKSFLANHPLENGFAHYYVSEGSILLAQYTDRIAWHTGNQWGNANLIGFEVCQSMSASDAQFLRNEEETFKLVAEVMKSYNMPINEKTVWLHKELSPTACPHRSWDLHGRSVASVKKYFVERIQFYANGGKAPAKAKGCKRIKAWSEKPHYKGTIQYNASLRQRSGSDFSNFRFDKEIGTLKKGETVYIFEEIQDAEGNIWCRTYSPSNNGWVHKHTIK
ncbi:N-acetylmuramoyl-L-alanine amidase [Macrococcoides caseolyticum]|uniref:N-acetylmuramoyl-L-alanine amidase n=1 Tax=Macrococcoides caseolyticum TaxID=69966 RepID=UPI000C34250A|nr:N-acetylmuramoyl-L-alanine amidase [Macrococcus caseolyticus]PKE47981.1 hypothetical protein CW677_06245 [Macrococcus caseolyticus]PKF14928.1 hypothetical protein CW690_06245 [Macrococcus caseolyticus]